jgi:hypothetical protein
MLAVNLLHSICGVAVTGHSRTVSSPLAEATRLICGENLHVSDDADDMVAERIGSTRSTRVLSARVAELRPVYCS